MAVRKTGRFVAFAMAVTVAVLQGGGALGAEPPAETPEAPPAARMELLLAPAEPVADPSAITVERVAGGILGAVPVRVRETGGEQLALDLDVPCEAKALFRVRAPGLVSLVFALPAAACDEGARPALEVPLLAAGQVAARFLPPAGGTRPAGGWWGVRDCAVPGRAPAFAFELPLAIDAEGLAEALVPAGCLDLRARFPGFAPEVELGAKVAPGGRLELAARRLRPAVSIALQVVDTGGRAPVRGATVLLVGAGQADRVLRRLVAGERPRAMARGETGEDGRLVFEDLAAGAYAVVVAPRSAALAPVARAVPALAPGARHDLGRLRERLAATLIVATEVGEASGAAELLVGLTLAGDDSLLEGPWRQVQLLPGGSVAVEGLPPGSWRVQLFALDRNGHLEPGGARTVELAEGETRVLAFAVPIVTETLLFHGRIVDDAEPEEGASEEEESLAFDLGVSWPEVEGRRGGTNFTPSAPDGSFTIRLPGPGTYLVEWFDPRRGQSTVVPEVRFEDPDEEVIVRSPRGRIEGRVVDEEGKPVREGFVGALAVTCEPGAECEFERPYPGISASIREDGSFALTRVAGGSYRITARAEKGEVESESQVVQLPEDGRLAGVVLVLRRSRPLDLAFVSPEGLPLVAIGGQVLALRADGEVDGHRFVTDARGNATVRLRGGARGRALVLLDAPGRAIAGFRVDTGRAGRHRLALPPTGSLVLRTGPRDQRTADEGLGGAAQLTGPLFLVGAEATLPLGGLVNVLQTGLPEGRLRLDGLAAGPWVLVRTPPELWLPALRGIVRGEPLPGAPLASFQLEPGGEVVLDLGATEPPAAP